MVFLILIVLVFGMILGVMQYGSAPNGGDVTAANPRAVVYAQNMETWHQAAMMTLTLDATLPGGKGLNNDTNCTTAGPTACDLNQYMRSPTAPFTFYSMPLNPPPAPIVSPLVQNWKEYEPIVPEGDPTQLNSGGWESFLMQNINGTQGGPGTESYVLTVFRGFGGCINAATCNNTNIGNNTGAINNTQLVDALGKTIQDRMGVGNLTCSAAAGTCTFTRAAAFNPRAPGNANQDLPLQFPISAFTVGTLVGTSLPAGQPVDQVFNNLPAIMTRVSGGISGQCPLTYVIWQDQSTIPAANPQYEEFPSSTNGTLTYQCAGTLNAQGGSEPISSNGSSLATYGGTLTATCSGGSWNINPGFTCSPGGVCPPPPVGSCPNNASATWAVTGTTGGPATCSGTMVSFGCGNTPRNGTQHIPPNLSPGFGGAGGVLCDPLGSGLWSFVNSGSGCTGPAGNPPGGTIGLGGATGSGSITSQ